MQTNFVIADTSYASKVFDSTQHVLLKWLTNANLNGHFDEDIDEPNEIFVIGSNGNLCGNIKSEETSDIINSLKYILSYESN